MRLTQPNKCQRHGQLREVTLEGKPPSSVKTKFGHLYEIRLKRKRSNVMLDDPSDFTILPSVSASFETSQFSEENKIKTLR
jgi:hypothetical protein